MTNSRIEEDRQRRISSDPAHAKADALHTRHHADVERIRANTRLSDVGKMQAIAGSYAAYRDGLAAMQADKQANTQRRAGQLTRSAFGVPTDPIQAMSYRDALARAEQIDSGQMAAWKLGEALETGDTLMAQAIARHGSQQGWNDVVNTYTAARPDVGTALGELSQIQTQQGDMQAKFFDAAYFSPQRPAELNKLDDYKIDELAAELPETA